MDGIRIRLHRVINGRVSSDGIEIIVTDEAINDYEHKIVYAMVDEAIAKIKEKENFNE